MPLSACFAWAPGHTHWSRQPGQNGESNYRSRNMLLASRRVDEHICNYVHIWEAVLPALWLYVLMSSSGSKRICRVYGCTSWSVKSWCEEFASVRQEGSNVPRGLRALLTLLQHQFNCWLVHVQAQGKLSMLACHSVGGSWMCSGDILTKSAPIN